ncbi:SWIM zinc finger family protein [Actinoplanes philippinensis]|uniref:SWIM zinc finger family protein n=1 Tax=Actinoplanes philippinensis TaxID=35752 RepID=UPI00116065BA|nr:SWIM zinc finger family protein [Actinoplanes philippinensis]
MAVLIDVPAFRESLPAAVAAAAERLLHDGAVARPEAVGGGARSVVTDGGDRFEPWVGVVDRALTGDCDCPAGAGDDGLCAHAVAVALAAFEDGIRFSAAGIPHGDDGDDEPDRADYRRAVESLGPRQLTELVVDQALRDRGFAARLLGRAGLLGGPPPTGLADAVRDASNVTGGGRWEIADVELAGLRLVAETEIVTVWPATVEMLDLVEEAIEVWDELAGILVDAWEVRRTDPEDVTEPLLAAHRALCERLELDSAEIESRIGRLADRCDFVPVT